ncbi:hypothetical protein RM844_04110 [Streptomyces sp. DSM 44915]|uniref:DUF5709 domain-containing protein n=1 Tax=Streptomyces chisholmiae TaxID=3075540 RepID=A0ABU2JLS2_9ACTN|nr:hypothetical protein [Streptomyces sp. DSM 44915]MDT0265474.1 hypothetical protein [Streptomyces sp. DSM 44915]
MTQEPTDPESLDEFLADAGDEERYADELPEETPREDAAEQRLDLLTSRDTPLTERGVAESDSADVAEQARVVDPGDDEYR